MTLNGLIPVASVALSPLVLWIGNILGRRTERERGRRDAQRVANEQFSSLNDALHRDVEDLRSRLENAERSLVTTNQLLAQVTAERHLDAVYISILRAHIEAGNPPPPPVRPSSLDSAHIDL